MALIVSDVRLERSPEEVFALFSDPRSELTWNPKVRQMEKLTDGDVGVGTRFRARWKSSPVVELEVVRFAPPRGWTFYNGGPIEVTLDIDLESLDGGRATHLRARFDARPHGAVRVLFPLMVRRLRREEAENMTHIKLVAEGR
jgi:uncharacterized protein YndB with AHSA1/START domain